MSDEEVRPAASVAWNGTGLWIHYLLIYPFMPVPEGVQGIVGTEPVFHPWLWLRTWFAKRAHRAQDDVLLSELCAQLVDIEAEGKRREAYAPQPDRFMQQVYARYYYESALKWGLTLRRQRSDVAPLTASASAARYRERLEQRLVGVMAEAIAARVEAELCDVPVTMIDMQYGSAQ